MLCHSVFWTIEHVSGYMNEKFDRKKICCYTLECYNPQCRVLRSQKDLYRCLKLLNTHGTWLLSLIFSSKPPFYPQFLPTNPLIIGTFGIFLITHVSGDTYDRKTKLLLCKSGTDEEKNWLKVPWNSNVGLSLHCVLIVSIHPTP